ncbi:hypothetical protein TNCV_1938641 [Trichonephila clavipes]|nr:hypothetical protein TNCV_1938641 [Trichonephila clavipes]
MDYQLRDYGCGYHRHCVTDRSVFNGGINDEPRHTNGEMSFFQMNPDSVYSIKMIASMFGGDQKDEIVCVPRIPLDTRGDFDMPIVPKRTQSPVRLAFAMTIYKPQVQSFENVEESSVYV